MNMSLSTEPHQSPQQVPTSQVEENQIAHFRRLIEEGLGVNARDISVKYEELMRNISFDWKDDAIICTQVCDMATAIELVLEKLSEYPATLPKDCDWDGRVKELYVDTIDTRDTLMTEFLGITHAIGAALKERGVDFIVQLALYQKTLNYIKDFCLLIYIGLTQSIQFHAFVHAVPNYFDKSPVSWMSAPEFRDLHVNVLSAVRKRWTMLKEEARAMLATAAHIEAKVGIDTASLIMDPLFDRLLDMFMGTRAKIDNLGEDIEYCRAEVAQTTVLDHISFNQGMEELEGDIEQFKLGIEDKTAFQTISKNLVMTHRKTLGAYLISTYQQKQKCGPQCQCGKRLHPKLMEDAQANRIAYEIDAELATLPEPSKEGVQLIEGIEQKYKLMIQLARSNIRDIDNMLYGSNMPSMEREKLRIKTITMRVLPLLMHATYEVKGLKDPAVRHLACIRASERSIGRQERWLAYMVEQGKWSMKVVERETEKAGLLVLSPEQKRMVSEGRTELICAHSVWKEREAGPGNGKAKEVVERTPKPPVGKQKQTQGRGDYKSMENKHG